MRIAHVATSISLNQIVRNQMIFQRERGHEVFAVCPDDEWADGIRKFGIPVVAVAFERHRVLASLWAAVQLWRLCRRERFDVVHTHNALPGILGRISARLAGVPVVLHTWHSWPLRLPRGLPHRLGFGVLEPVATWAARVVLFLNPDDQATWSALPGVDARKGILIGNGINVDEFTARAKPGARARVRSELGLDDDAFVVVKVARLEHPRKGHDFFLHGLQRFLARTHRKTAALLVGTGFDREAIQREIARFGLEGVVRFTGYREDVADVISAADVSVLVSPFEGIPRALMESMALGVPVIGADVAGTHTLVQADVNGLLVPFGDVEALADALARVAGSPELCRRLGEAGRERVGAAFNEPVVAARVVEIYERLLQGSADPLPRWDPVGARETARAAQPMPQPSKSGPR